MNVSDGWSDKGAVGGRFVLLGMNLFIFLNLDLKPRTDPD